MEAQYTKPNNKRNRKNLAARRHAPEQGRLVEYENDFQKVLRRLGPVGRKPAIVADRDPQATSPPLQGLRSAGSAIKFYRAIRPI